MSIKERFDIKSINKSQTKQWILKKHYAKRMPIIKYAFGLIKDKEIVGVCTFGITSRQETSFWEERGVDIYELNRLVTKDNLPKNSLSYFVAGCIDKMPSPCILISYADKDMGHHGYIYQATNWYFVGKTKEGKHYNIFINGEQVHPRVLNIKHGTCKKEDLEEIYDNIEFELEKGKYKYYYINGNKREKRDIKEMLKERHKIKPYPKGDNKYYDTSKKIKKRKMLI